MIEIEGEFVASLAGCRLGSTLPRAWCAVFAIVRQEEGSECLGYCVSFVLPGALRPVTALAPRSGPTSPYLSSFSPRPTALLHRHVEWAHVAWLTSLCDLCIVFVSFFSVHHCPSESLVKCYVLDVQCVKCWTCSVPWTCPYE